MADIFVSYTSSDREWYAWLEQRHDAADHVLCVVSDAYLKAPYSTLERNAALWQAVSKRRASCFWWR
jgi:hypothetical protein